MVVREEERGGTTQIGGQRAAQGGWKKKTNERKGKVFLKEKQ